MKREGTPFGGCQTVRFALLLVGQILSVATSQLTGTKKVIRSDHVWCEKASADNLFLAGKRHEKTVYNSGYVECVVYIRSASDVRSVGKRVLLHADDLSFIVRL